MSFITDLVEPLKRGVAVPGTFTELFPETTDDDLEGVLYDAIAEAQLDGFLASHDVDDLTGTVIPDVTRAGGSPTPAGALVLLYAITRLVDAEIRNRKTHIRYESKGNVFEQDQTASLLVEVYRQLKDRKKDLLEQARIAGYATAIHMADAYFIRSTVDYTPTVEDRAYAALDPFGSP